MIGQYEFNEQIHKNGGDVLRKYQPYNSAACYLYVNFIYCEGVFTKLHEAGRRFLNSLNYTSTALLKVFYDYSACIMCAATTCASPSQF